MEDSTMREVGAETLPTEQAQEQPVTQETAEGAEPSTEGTTESQTETTVSDDKEYLSQFEGLPDDVESVDDIVKEYIALKQKGNEAPVQAQPIAPQQPIRTQPEHTPEIIPKSLMAGRITEAIQSGRIPEEYASSYKFIASEVDATYRPVLETLTSVMGIMASELTTLRQGNRASQWNALAPEIRGAVPKAELDAIMDQNGLVSYEQALMHYAIHRDPKVVTRFAQTQRKEGEQQGRNKTFKKFSALRRGTPQPSFAPKHEYSKYLRPDGSFDTQAILNAHGGDYNKVVEIKKAYAADYEKEHSQTGR